MEVTKDIAGELARSHIMAFPSRYEGFPNALAEAMAAGLPAIAFEEISGVEDLIAAGESGLIVRWGTTPGETVKSLTEGLDQFMNSVPLRIDLWAAAKRCVIAFRPELILERWRDLIATVTGKRGGASFEL